MVKKNIIIISYSYPPSNAPAAQRPYTLAKYLDKKKYKVTVITCANEDSSLGFDNTIDFNLEDVEVLRIDSLLGKGTSQYRDSLMVNKNKVLRFSRIKKNFFRFFSKFIIPDKAIFWYPKVVKFLNKNNKLINGIDVVFSTSPLFTNHLIAYSIKKKNDKIKWIVDFRDFHYLKNYERRFSILAIINRFFEKKIIYKADYLTFISEAMQSVYEKNYPKIIKKTSCIYNGYDPEEFNKIKALKTNNKTLKIFYAGSFYRGIRSPFQLFQLLDLSFYKNHLKPEEVEINIAGNFEIELITELKKYNSFKCVNFLGKIPRSNVLSELCKSDLLWLIVGNKETHFLGIPIKFYEYLASGRPILNFAPSKAEVNKIIKKYNIGWSFYNDNFNEEKEYIKFLGIIKLYKKGLLQESLKSKSLLIFNRTYQTKQFEQIIN